MFYIELINEYNYLVQVHKTHQIILYQYLLQKPNESSIVGVNFMNKPLKRMVETVVKNSREYKQRLVWLQLGGEPHFGRRISAGVICVWARVNANCPIKPSPGPVPPLSNLPSPLMKCLEALFGPRSCSSSQRFTARN